MKIRRLDSKAKNRNEQTALHLAVDHGFVDVALVLVEGGADVASRNQAWVA
jgi:ankyrin repeat protein